MSSYKIFHKTNTKKSIDDAIFFNSNMVEIDIQITKDDVIILHHDLFCNNHLVCHLHYHEVKQMNKNILTLCEYLNLLPSFMDVLLDIKGNDLKICWILDLFLKKNCSGRNIFISSFNYNIIHKLSNINPNLNLGLHIRNILPFVIYEQFISSSNLKFVVIHWSMIEENNINFFHSKNVSIFTYTLNSETLHHYMDQFSVDGIIFDISKEYKKKAEKEKAEKKKRKYIFICILFVILFLLILKITYNRFQITSM